MQKLLTYADHLLTQLGPLNRAINAVAARIAPKATALADECDVFYTYCQGCCNRGCDALKWFVCCEAGCSIVGCC